MAENNEDENSSKFNRNPVVDDELEHENDDNTFSSLALDLGNGNNRFGERTSDNPSVTDPTFLKKEDNPFSFKHFLNQKSSSQNKGARPKTYGNVNIGESSNPSRLLSGSEMSSVLPDFVQDHLVVEQCYLNSGGNISVENLHFENLHDIEQSEFTVNDSRSNSQNLPDFAISAGQNYNSELTLGMTDCLPDFTMNVNYESREHVLSQCGTSSHNKTRSQMSSSPSVPLYDNYHSPDQGLPFDLPLNANTSDSNSTRGLPTSESVSKSLPDFLSDGPIRQERLDESNPDREVPIANSHQYLDRNGLANSGSHSRSESDRLEREVENLRRQLNERNRRITFLESEIQSLRSRDRQDAASLESALQQVENNLQETIARAVSAENTVFKLKQENKLLKSDLSLLRSENSELRMGNNLPTRHLNNRRLAQDLRTAAATAETSLKTLLTGVDNLRLLAATVENINQDRKDEFRDFNYDDSASGPAL